MRSLLALTLLVGLFGCAKQDDPVPPAPSSSSNAKSAQVGSGTTVAGTPFVPGAGAVSPVQGGDFGDGGGGVAQSALGKARGVAGKMSQPPPQSGDTAGD